MIQKVEGFKIFCDRCEEPLGDDYVVILDSEDEITDYLQDQEWKEIDGKHYCAGCLEEDGTIKTIPIEAERIAKEMTKAVE